MGPQQRRHHRGSAGGSETAVRDLVLGIWDLVLEIGSFGFGFGFGSLAFLGILRVCDLVCVELGAWV